MNDYIIAGKRDTPDSSGSAAKAVTVTVLEIAVTVIGIDYFDRLIAGAGGTPITSDSKITLDEDLSRKLSHA